MVCCFLFSLNMWALNRIHIVEVAISQLGRSDQDARCPAEGCYYGYGTNWCSEFVSWVYNQANEPFSSGKPIDWLLNDTVKIRSWFRAQGKFIDRQSSQWKSFSPQPGDYVFIGRANEIGGFTSRQHSGIVEYVDELGNLHTIEGNNNHRPVERYVYSSFRINSTENGLANGIVLGFGDLSQ